MRWGGVLVATSWLALGHGPAAAQGAGCTDIGDPWLLLGSHPASIRLFAPLHPSRGSAFGSTLSALSWNYLAYRVASSSADPEDPRSGFDPGDPYAPDRCSFANPGRCASVRGIPGVRGRPGTVRIAGRKARHDRFTLDVSHPGIAPSEDPAALGASLVVSSLDPAGGSTGTIDLAPDRWRELRKGGELVGYRYRDLARSRGGVWQVVLRDGRLAIHARGPAWTRQTLGAAGEVWVHLSVGAEGWCGAFSDDRRAGPRGPSSTAPTR
jgi:hypothetical protein